MDIHPYLERWQAIEPLRCSHYRDDFWLFTFDAEGTGKFKTHRCDVISFHGVGIVEDLVSQCIQNRPGWTYTLKFDRDAETFSAVVFVANGTPVRGEESLNPGISLLSAYLQALVNP